MKSLVVRAKPTYGPCNHPGKVFSIYCAGYILSTNLFSHSTVMVKLYRLVSAKNMSSSDYSGGVSIFLVVVTHGPPKSTGHFILKLSSSIAVILNTELTSAELS